MDARLPAHSPGADAYFDGTRDNVAAFLPPTPGPVLEIGCGRGGFRSHLAAGVEYWGVDADAGAAQQAQARLHRVIATPLDRAWDELPVGHFDGIVCNDVIEHLPDHDAFLRRIRAKMRPGGWIVGSIPNVRYVANLLELLVKKDWRYREAGILDRTHLRFFTERSLRRSFGEHGYRIDALHGIDPAKVPWHDRRALPIAACSLLLGADTRFRQFGFRVRA